MIKKSLFLLLILSIIFTDICYAKGEDDRYFEAEKTIEVENIVIKPKVTEDKMSCVLGGWFNFMYRQYINDENDKDKIDLLHYTVTEDWRFWLYWYLNKYFSFYVRLKNYVIQRSIEPGYSELSGDYNAPSLDSTYFLFKFAKTQLKVGRQYIYVGRGIAYEDINDGVKFTFQLKDFYTKSFWMRTKPSQDNVDTSVPNYSKQGRRFFYGTEISYLGIKNNLLYAYFVGQKDRQNKVQDSSYQSFGYDSGYYGLGLEGKQEKFLNYWWEIIRERGQNYTDGAIVSMERKYVDAWSLISGVRFNKDVISHPFLEYEYAFGSGDKDRRNVVKTKYGGNRYGNDENFLYFGNFFGGYASRFRLSNLHIWKLEAGCKPWEKFSFGKDITMGLKYFIYRKDKPTGAIYDDEAGNKKNYVGQELNAYLYCQHNKYALTTFRYGVFFPGNAYLPASSDPSQFFSAALTISF